MEKRRDLQCSVCDFVFCIRCKTATCSKKFQTDCFGNTLASCFYYPSNIKFLHGKSNLFLIVATLPTMATFPFYLTFSIFAVFVAFLLLGVPLLLFTKQQWNFEERYIPNFVRMFALMNTLRLLERCPV